MICRNDSTIRDWLPVRPAATAALALLFWLGGAVLGGEPEQPKTSKAPTANTVNLCAENEAEYTATETPTIVNVGPGRYLAISGKGEPGGNVFRRKTGALYGVAYGLKMKSKFAGRDYLVSPLEGLWWGTEDMHAFMGEPKETWNWKLLIRTPDFITEKDLAATVDQMAGQDKDAAAREIKLETLNEGRSVQILHIGPYAEEEETIATLHAFIKEKGLERREPHHEIYLSDPNRTPPEELRTILRQPVK